MGCLFPTVSSPSDYDTAPDVMEPVETALLRSGILDLCRIIFSFHAHTLTMLLLTIKYEQGSKTSKSNSRSRVTKRGYRSDNCPTNSKVIESQRSVSRV